MWEAPWCPESELTAANPSTAADRTEIGAALRPLPHYMTNEFAKLARSEAGC
jgi:hypothetical protein